MWILFLHITIRHRHVYNCITLRHWNVNHISRLDRVLGFMYTQSGRKSSMVISGNFPNQIEVLMVKSKDVGKSPINYKHWHETIRKSSHQMTKNPASHVWRRANNTEPRNNHGWLGDCSCFHHPNVCTNCTKLGNTADSAGNTANNT